MASTTKEKILDVSSTLFSKYGYKGTSVRKIASSVGIRESALYNHFKNKDEIFFSVLEYLFNEDTLMDIDVEEIALKGKVFLNKFTTNYKLQTFDKTKENMFRLLMIELLQNEQIRKDFMENFHNKNIKLLSNGFFIMMQNGIIKSSDPMLLAYEYLSTLFYIRLQILLLKTDAKSINHLSTQFEKHTDFFWESIKV